MSPFAGFPSGKVRFTSIPAPFFSELLPEIDQVGELKVTLYALWFLDQQEGQARYVAYQDFTGDRRLMKGLGSSREAAVEELDHALERACRARHAHPRPGGRAGRRKGALLSELAARPGGGESLAARQMVARPGPTPAGCPGRRTAQYFRPLRTEHRPADANDRRNLTAGRAGISRRLDRRCPADCGGKQRPPLALCGRHPPLLEGERTPCTQ